MTTISASIVADSISSVGIRLTTFLLRYPRWIHAEGRTHRQLRIGEELELPTPSLMEDPNLSRNASSSRAIPVNRLIQDVMEDPAIPLFWGANQRGMQAGAECDTEVYLLGGPVSREDAWLRARDHAIRIARAFSEAGYHKQIVNRLLEPFSHINVVVTATEWTNFFALRDHADAEPHIHLLAQRMKAAMAGSSPRLREFGSWHLPFVTDQEIALFGNERCLSASVARCARTSYMTHDGRFPPLEEDIKLADRLLASVPLHASPAEHQATPDIPLEYPPYWEHPRHHGNLHGWCQYRKTLPGECQ